MTSVPTSLRRSKRDRTLITPEGIAVPVAVASRGARAGALALDLMFIVLIMIGGSMALFYTAGGAMGLRAADKGVAGHVFEFLAIVWIIAMFLLRNAYFLFFELGPRGATPGKRIAGIRIAARDGGRLTAEMVLARNLLRDIEILMPIAFIAAAGADSGLAWLTAAAWFAIFLLFPYFNRDALRAGDIIAGTWVLERPRHKLLAALTSRQADTPPAPSYAFSEAELAVYGEFELQALERVLRDRKNISLDQVYQTIAGKIGRNDGWGDERAFLEAYYAQLRARLEAGMRMGRRKSDKYSGEA
ncbi:RDD family protein [Novosphingobium colocasiae]|uniref:RDD family protein n=1 Tax=Novosphingobium colocasiae TaxID=1256513 RepID=UPI0035B21EED